MFDIHGEKKTLDDAIGNDISNFELRMKAFEDRLNGGMSKPKSIDSESQPTDSGLQSTDSTSQSTERKPKIGDVIDLTIV